MRLILVRHPKPLCEPGLCYGRLDLPCDPTALDEAALRLAPLAEGCRLVTSPARRALSLALRLDLAPVVEPRLIELDFGDWEGRRWAEIGKEPIEIWQRGLPSSAPPAGESLTDLGTRCAAWLTESKVGPPIFAVAHAGPIRVIRALLEGKPLLFFFDRSVPYAEPITLEVDPNWRVPLDAAQDKCEQKP